MPKRSGTSWHRSLLQIAKTAFPKFKPMLVPPAPWRSANTGAHLTMRSFVMRMGEQQANRRLLEAADRDMAEGKPGASQVDCWKPAFRECHIAYEQQPGCTSGQSQDCNRGTR